MKALTLEFNTKFQKANTELVLAGMTVSFCPPVDEDYWVFRVRLHEGQSIIGFPKFNTIGIGFAQEDDWNTNLPYTSDAMDICDHIIHNKGHEEITEQMCLDAIRLIQDACQKFHQPHYQS